MVDIFSLAVCCTADEIKHDLWERLMKPFEQRISELHSGHPQAQRRHVRYNSDGEEIHDVIVIDEDDDEGEDEGVAKLPSIGSTFLQPLALLVGPFKLIYCTLF